MCELTHLVHAFNRLQGPKGSLRVKLAFLRQLWGSCRGFTDAFYVRSGNSWGAKRLSYRRWLMHIAQIDLAFFLKNQEVAHRTVRLALIHNAFLKVFCIKLRHIRLENLMLDGRIMSFGLNNLANRLTLLCLIINNERFASMSKVRTCHLSSLLPINSSWVVQKVCTCVLNLI